MMRDDVLAVLNEAYRAVVEGLGSLADWGAQGSRPDQFACDIVADEAAFKVLDAAGVGVVSEERNAQGLERDIVVVVDPVDGTANAIRGIPYYAISLCAVDRQGMQSSLVVNLATGTRFEAVRGQGALCDGRSIVASDCSTMEAAWVAVCGHPRQEHPWRHMRAFGATALELCDVARGLLDAYVNTDVDAIAPWDYLGALLVCHEAGAVSTDGLQRPLVTTDPAARRAPVVAATPSLLAEAVGYAWPGQAREIADR